MTPDELREVPLFAGLSQETLTWLAERVEEMRLPAGKEFIAEGARPHAFYVVLDGEIIIAKQLDGEEIVIASRQDGAFVGEISMLTGSPHMASVRTERESRLLKMDAATFQEMLSTCSSVASIILRATAERIKETEAWVQQREKLAALGSLAAGLAHELNNPASAACRSAGQLRSTLVTLQTLAIRLGELNLTPAQLDFADRFQRELLERKPPKPLDPITQSDREEALIAWMKRHGVEDGWKFAPALVNAGLDETRLESIASQIDNNLLRKFLLWLDGTLTAEGLIRTIEQSSNRISDLVKRVKAYAYMDQAPVQEIDVHEALENTLSILGHKLNGITVVRKYDPNLPDITAFGGELNQVWTNLIDNAIDALDGKGQITLRTDLEGDSILVEVADDGPGIPEDVQVRIFEPFFTTKGVGHGTGLGLDISYKIVVNRHRGDIRLFSQPGDTRFQVRLPINPA